MRNKMRGILTVAFLSATLAWVVPAAGRGHLV